LKFTTEEPEEEENDQPDLVPKASKDQSCQLLTRALDMASTSASIMDKKLLVLYTGGTMGMNFDEKDGALSPKKGYLTARIMELPEIGRSDMPQFDIIEYERLIDSSCMGPPDWIKIASDIEDNYLKYDGFVIIMGTVSLMIRAVCLLLSPANSRLTPNTPTLHAFSPRTQWPTPPARCPSC
jgi:L-asparaginase/Glu-tRNA(Gln) amidotransferase subunit D